MAAQGGPGTTDNHKSRYPVEAMSDEINNPKHYQLFPGMEAIDVIEAALTPAEFIGYLKGNALKYRLRAGDKGPAVKCIAKAHWYQNRLWNLANGAGAVAWTDDETRINSIGQNGNTGEHYDDFTPQSAV